MFWFENDIRELENKLKSDDLKSRNVAIGSTSIQMWNSIEEDFPKAQIVNLGFRGATLASCAWYFDRVVLPFEPKSILLYAGDNDLGNERYPEEVLIFFQQFVSLVRKHLNDIPVAFISIKPSLARWNVNDRIKFTNDLIKKETENDNSNLYFIDIYQHMLNEHNFPISEFYLENGLHMNRKGYELWQEEILKFSNKLFS
jgi:lysophospholipase L1-like esterase